MSLKSIISPVCVALALIFMTSGCFENPSLSDQLTAQSNVFIAESDFQSGLLEWMPTTTNTISSAHLPIFSDAVVRTFDGYLYILERFGADNIMKFDPKKNDPSGVLYQVHACEKGNPQDIVFKNSTKAYITNMNKPEITIFNPSTGTSSGHIDISAYTFRPDSNTSPYANDMELVGNELYVMLQRRHLYNPGAPTLVLKINTLTDVITDTMPLTYKNGYAMAYADNALYVCSPGSHFSVGDGGIEKIDLCTKEVTTVFDEAALGGNPNLIVHEYGPLFYVTNYKGWKSVSVLEIHVLSKRISTLQGVIDAFGGIFYDSIDTMLYVGERDSVHMGIRRYKHNTQIGSVIKSVNSLPPASIVVVRH